MTKMNNKMMRKPMLVMMMMMMLLLWLLRMLQRLKNECYFMMTEMVTFNKITSALSRLWSFSGTGGGVCGAVFLSFFIHFTTNSQVSIFLPLSLSYLLIVSSFWLFHFRSFYFTFFLLSLSLSLSLVFWTTFSCHNVSLFLLSLSLSRWQSWPTVQLRR